jgi:hypothetical protein
MSLSRSAAQFFKNKASSLTNTVSSLSSAVSSSAATVSGLLTSTNTAASSSLSYARGGLTRTQAQLARLSPFALLAFAQEVAGYTEQVYVHDDSTYPPTDYRFTYESSDFPNLRNEIREHISTASIESFPATAFVHDSTPACRYSSAAIELSIETGRAMSRFFSDGLDAAMAHMCPTDPYDNTHSTPSRPLTQAEIIVICCVAGLVVVGACAVTACKSNSRSVDNSGLRTPLNTPSSSDVVIHVHDSHHHDHHHHDHDHDHHDHSSHSHSTGHSNVLRLP